MSVMTLLLGAEDAGLGALFFGVFHHEVALRRELGIPDDLELPVHRVPLVVSVEKVEIRLEARQRVETVAQMRHQGVGAVAFDRLVIVAAVIVAPVFVPMRGHDVGHRGRGHL